MKKQRIYLDTSEFSGFFNDEFQEFTEPLFERIDNEEFILLLFSIVLEAELESAPQNGRKLVYEIENENTEFNVSDN